MYYLYPPLGCKEAAPEILTQFVNINLFNKLLLIFDGKWSDLFTFPMLYYYRNKSLTFLSDILDRILRHTLTLIAVNKW